MADPYLPLVEAWETISLNPRVFTDYIKDVRSGGTPRTGEDEFWDGDIPWLTPKEIARNGRVELVSGTDRRITQSGSRSSSAKPMPPGTVMLTKRAPVGAVAINTVPMATNQGFLNFVCGPKLRPMYLAQWMHYSRPYFERLATGSTYPELYQADLGEFLMSVPPLEEQDRILKIVKATNLLVNLSEARARAVVELDEVAGMHRVRRQLEAMRRRIIPLLLSGRIGR